MGKSTRMEKERLEPSCIAMLSQRKRAHGIQISPVMILCNGVPLRAADQYTPLQQHAYYLGEVQPHLMAIFSQVRGPFTGLVSYTA